MLWVNYTSKINSEKEIRFVVTRGGELTGVGNWMKVIKRFRLPVVRGICET